MPAGSSRNRPGLAHSFETHWECLLAYRPRGGRREHRVEGRPEPGRGTVKKRGGRGFRFSERPPTQENKRIRTSSWFDSFQALTGLHGSFRPGAEAHQPEALPALPRLRSPWVSEAPPLILFACYGTAESVATRADPELKWFQPQRRVGFSANVGFRCQADSSS